MVDRSQIWDAGDNNCDPSQVYHPTLPGQRQSPTPTVAFCCKPIPMRLVHGRPFYDLNDLTIKLSEPRARTKGDARAPIAFRWASFYALDNANIAVGAVPERA